MTLGQHRAMNNFLNEAVKASMPQPGSNRIPLSYAHKKERDTFYEISINELPPVVQHNIHPRHKPRVRVTTDQRTGEVVSKIVKCRIADLDVYSPRTHVDWRVADLGSTRGRGGSERTKDRMSYRHLAYQIDLTQVALAENPTKADFEHELEVEVSAAEVRRQGDLALAGDPKNQYEDLIKGFIDNVRVLARAVPAQ
ncbi:mRNA capping enzyme beta chain [Rasamsonia emersonii CBS 393.64]|uniref:mRNA-capping enzyme subunit beta n=1 Tax=Rasamsonia emersonii (strain ATCC 16479 / CBS 393.64 / IMI 116815) TaxID=1408163 RepID=A0A0F4Z7J8_RASE3|nr:mRNA capping enzyme beta chain [Rasamsonia emersonii CBS 393.64]KKA25828.1 mRNA capping enzyme beta chain [Rasamsonia emersonii CBS 393.64]